MKTKDILQIWKDFPFVTGVQDPFPGDTLVEDIMQNFQRADMSSLGVKQFWRERGKQDCNYLLKKVWQRGSKCEANRSQKYELTEFSLINTSLAGPYPSLLQNGAMLCCISMFEWTEKPIDLWLVIYSKQTVSS